MTFRYLCTSLVMLACFNAASAQTVTMPSGLEITGAWIRFAPPVARTHAGYFTLTNRGREKRVLVGAASPAYGRAELHISKVERGVATMLRLEQVEIAPGKSILFKPGGMHVMLMGPKSAQKQGAIVPATLLFQNGEKVTVKAMVKRSSAKPMMHHRDHGKSRPHKMKMK